MEKAVYRGTIRRDLWGKSGRVRRAPGFDDPNSAFYRLFCFLPDDPSLRSPRDAAKGGIGEPGEIFVHTNELGPPGDVVSTERGKAGEGIEAPSRLRSETAQEREGEVRGACGTAETDSDLRLRRRRHRTGGSATCRAGPRGESCARAR